MKSYKLDIDGYDRCIDVYRDGELISHTYYELNNNTDMGDLVSELNRMSKLINSLQRSLKIVQ